ncbi:glycoside hydrolase family 28 protein [Paenibacillus daejeonensis]|uniref:glycoside hydrolase family 28 protein n=1 Tax=Paenibacillus daejeonensis TaxID=135193 RepID=UPI000369A4DC|nr:glycosyl hydrolase family 28 protein [Paenibacillus daejeonensis]
MKAVKRMIMLMTAMLGLAIGLLTMNGEVQANGSYTAYDLPASVFPESQIFDVELNGDPIKVYQHTRFGTSINSHFVHYSQDGPMQITVRAAAPIQQYTISPQSYGIQGTVSGNTLTFTIDGPEYLILQINNYEKLLIMADPMETNAPASQGAGVYNVSSAPYLADPTGAALTTGAIQGAIDDASQNGGGVVYVPQGLYKVATLHLKENVHLYLEGGAVLRGTGNPADYVQYSTRTSNQTPVYLQVHVDEGADNVRISGRGVIDANGIQLAGNHTNDNNFANMIHAVLTTNVNDFEMEGVIVTNSTYWTIITAYNDGVDMHNVKVVNAPFYDHNDGIDIAGSRNVRVIDSFVFTGDDALCVKPSGPYGMMTPWGASQPMYNVVFDGGVVYSRAAGTKAGIQAFDHMYDIWFQNIEVVRASRGISIMHQQGSALMEDIHFVNINVEELLYKSYEPYPIEMRVINDSYGNGNVRNVEVKNVRFLTAGNTHSRIYGLSAAHKIEGVTFEDLYIAGELITSLAQGNIQTNSHVSGIQFLNQSPWNLMDDPMTNVLSRWSTTGSGGQIQQNASTLHIVSTQTSGSNAYFFLTKNQFQAPVGPFTLETRVRANAPGTRNQVTVRSANYQVSFYVTYGTQGTVQNKATNPDRSFTLDTTQYHTYRMVVHPNYTYDLYVDGQLAFSGAASQGSGSDLIKLGAESQHTANMTLAFFRMGNGIILP